MQEQSFAPLLSLDRLVLNSTQFMEISTVASASSTCYVLPEVFAQKSSTRATTSSEAESQGLEGPLHCCQHIICGHVRHLDGFCQLGSCRRRRRFEALLQSE